jgi:hypothetical protein
MATTPPASRDIDTGSGTAIDGPAKAAPLAIMLVSTTAAEMRMLRIRPFLSESAVLLAAQASHGCDRDNAANHKRHRNRFRKTNRCVGRSDDHERCRGNREHLDCVFHNFPKRKDPVKTTKQL